MLLTRTRCVATIAALAVAACSPTSPNAVSVEACPAGFLGKVDAAPDFDIQVLGADNTAVTIDGGPVPLLMPPQGGRVIFAGVRATNVDGCGLQLTGALRNLTTGRVTFDSRTINLTATGDGWGTSATSADASAIGSFSNIPVCPNEWSASDLFGQPYWLEMTVTDRGKRQVAKKIQVTPECAQPDNLGQCLCICMAGYVLGQTCGDAGTD